MSALEKEGLIGSLQELKNKILEAENEQMRISEQDSRQGLINPLFHQLGWDFGDFRAVKAEFRDPRYNEPVDYAFFGKDQKKPLLLVEAKALGTNLDNAKIVKQLCTYLGEIGVQWGLLTDGNKYIMYNANAGVSFEDKKFITMQIKTADTDDGIPVEELARKLQSLLSRDCLENENIQKFYESHVIDRHIEDALLSLLSEPFDTLASAIRKEFREERVKVTNIRITNKRVINYLEAIKDDEGRILPFSDSSTSASDDMVQTVALSQEKNIDVEEASKRTKRITILDLLHDGLVEEGDSWRFENKGEISWGRITGNGEIDIGGKTYSSPSQAGSSITGKGVSGWGTWSFRRNGNGEWTKIEALRKEFRQRHNLQKIIKAKKGG